MAVAAEPQRWHSMDERKHGGENLYYLLYRQTMERLPSDAHRFCDPELPATRRKELLRLLRGLEDDASCQRLQIIFAFSVPSPEALQLILDLGVPVVSAGSGTGYWEFLLRSRGLDVVAFDVNGIYPQEMRYTEILDIFFEIAVTGLFLTLDIIYIVSTRYRASRGILIGADPQDFVIWFLAGTPFYSSGCLLTGRGVLRGLPVFITPSKYVEAQRTFYNTFLRPNCAARNGDALRKTSGPVILEQFPDRALLLAWPDAEESSTFSLDCLNYYRGDLVLHVGELLGETLSANPWGMSTSRDFQLALAEDFCCVRRLRLPNWPGHWDSFSVWRRKNPQPVVCDGAHFHYVDMS